MDNSFLITRPFAWASFSTSRVACGKSISRSAEWLVKQKLPLERDSSISHYYSAGGDQVPDAI